MCVCRPSLDNRKVRRRGVIHLWRPKDQTIQGGRRRSDGKRPYCDYVGVRDPAGVGHRRRRRRTEQDPVVNADSLLEAIDRLSVRGGTTVKHERLLDEFMTHVASALDCDVLALYMVDAAGDRLVRRT